MAGVLTSLKDENRGESMIISTTTRREEHLEQPISKDVSVARGLLDREALLQTLDRAVSKRITVVSAPAGSGKTSLLRAWPTARRTVLASRSCPSTATSRMRSDSGPRSWMRSAARQRRAILRCNARR